MLSVKWFFAVALVMVLIKNSPADIIYLKGDKTLFGQVMAIREEEIILEVISTVDNALEIQSYPLAPVLKIMDESGIILYENKKARFENLNSYYSLMENNWEELKYKIRDSIKQVIRFSPQNKQEAHIVSITSAYVFTEKKIPDSEDIEVTRIPLQDIISINNVRVRFTNFNITKRLLLSETKYPLFQIQIGYDFVQSKYSSLQDLFQDFYDQNNLNSLAAKRSDIYPGIFLKFEMYLKSYLSLGLNANYYKGTEINELTLTIVDIKYLYRTSYLHPWIAVGYAGQQFASSENAKDVKYEWLNTASTLCFAGGINSGKERGFGFNLAVHYLPFGEGRTRIKTAGLDQTSSARIDFSLLKISLGMHYSFN